jgi:predicted dehydrogenase
MTYRAAIVGAGAPVAKTNSNLEGFSIGYHHANGYLAHPQVEVVAVADIRIENADALAQHAGGATAYRDLTEMLANEQIDIISICTWPTLHAPMVVAAIDAGVPMILCEKPMGVSVAEADLMMDRANAAGVRLFVNHQRRYDQPFAGARRLIADGHLGEVLRVEGYVGDGWDIMSWGSHWVDMARYLTGSEVSWVLAAAASTGNIRYGHLVEDQMVVQMGFDSGALGLIHTGPHQSGAGFIVVGTRGTILIGQDTATLMTSDQDSADLHSRYLTVAPDRTPAFSVTIADIIAATEAGESSLIDATSGHADLEVIMAAFESAANAEVVHIADLDRETTRVASHNL